MQIIEDIAEEGSSFFPTIEFLDEAQVSMTPDTLFWKLTDMDGNIINERAAVEVETPGTSLTPALHGADLAVMGKDIASRLITCWGTYTSDTYGDGMTFLFQAKFNIQPHVGE